jgi:hypothetical protein
LDFFLAHLAYIWILSETIYFSKNQVWLFLFPVTTIMLWIAENNALSHKKELHVALHCVSVVGVHAYMNVLYG